MPPTVYSFSFGPWAKKNQPSRAPFNPAPPLVQLEIYGPRSRARPPPESLRGPDPSFAIESRSDSGRLPLRCRGRSRSGPRAPMSITAPSPHAAQADAIQQRAIHPVAASGRQSRIPFAIIFASLVSEKLRFPPRQEECRKRYSDPQRPASNESEPIVRLKPASTRPTIDGPFTGMRVNAGP